MNESTQEPTEKQWEADFQRWGKRPQPELRPFFYTRLQARLAKSVEQTDWLPWWLRKPVYAYSALLLLVLLNVGAAWWTTTHSQTTPDQMATTTTNSLLDDYDVDPVVLAYE